MEKYHTQVIKWQEEVHTSQYVGSGDDTHHYAVLEHEAVVLFNAETGESRIVRHTDDIKISGAPED